MQSISPSLQAPPPSVHSGISVLEAQEALSRQQKQGSRVEGAPPAYCEVIGHYYHPTSLNPSHTHRTVSSSQPPPSSLIHGLLRPTLQQQGNVDNRNARNTKEKSQKPQQVWWYYFFPSLQENQEYVCLLLGKQSVPRTTTWSMVKSPLNGWFMLVHFPDRARTGRQQQQHMLVSC